MNTYELKQRVVELETRSAFQEQAINDLSQVIVDQQAEIEKTGQMMQRLAGRVASVEEYRGEGLEPESPPPHY